jgi:DHA1 family tetracycline resistance protein-like MFS transporter
MLFGAGMGAIGFTLYGLAPSGYWFWAAMPIAALWAVASPASLALMTQRVSPQEQGRLQGAIGSLNSIAGIFGPTLFTQTLASVAHAGVHDVWAGVTFWLAAAIVALGGVIGWRATRPAAATA